MASEKTAEEIMAEIFPKKKTITWQMTIKLLEPGHKTKTLKADRKKGTRVTCKGTNVRKVADFLLESLQVQREWI